MTSGKAKKKEFWMGMLFISPGLLGFIIFILVPVIISIVLSFAKWNFLQGFDAIEFIGLDNYVKLFSDDWFKASYKNNILFTVVTVPVLTGLGLVMAEIINKYVFGSQGIRVMMFIPYIASIVAVCTVWQVIFQPSFGPVNQFLQAIGIENPPKWFVDYKWSLYSIMMVYIWQQLGYTMIVYLAGLKAVPHDVYEAASIDGAGPIRQFFSVTVPLVSPTTFFLVIMGIIGSFKVFDHISLLTAGGPGNSSSVMAFYVYRTAFEEFKVGYANTLAWALFVLIFVVTLIQFKFQSKFSNE